MIWNKYLRLFFSHVRARLTKVFLFLIEILMLEKLKNGMFQMVPIQRWCLNPSVFLTIQYRTKSWEKGIWWEIWETSKSTGKRKLVFKRWNQKERWSHQHFIGQLFKSCTRTFYLYNIQKHRSQHPNRPAKYK